VLGGHQRKSGLTSAPRQDRADGGMTGRSHGNVDALCGLSQERTPTLAAELFPAASRYDQAVIF
jgi:hypothetical protein